MCSTVVSKLALLRKNYIAGGSGLVAETTTSQGISSADSKPFETFFLALVEKDLPAAAVLRLDVDTARNGWKKESKVIDAFIGPTSDGQGTDVLVQINDSEDESRAAAGPATLDIAKYGTAKLNLPKRTPEFESRKIGKCCTAVPAALVGPIAQVRSVISCRK